MTENDQRGKACKEQRPRSYKAKRGREREMRAPFPGRQVGAAAGGWGKGGGGINGGSCQALRRRTDPGIVGSRDGGCSTERTQNPTSWGAEGTHDDQPPAVRTPHSDADLWVLLITEEGGPGGNMPCGSTSRSPDRLPSFPSAVRSRLAESL